MMASIAQVPVATGYLGDTHSEMHGRSMFLWENVRDPLYAAIGDGATDDTTALSTALGTVITAGSGAVYIPGGRYLITSKIVKNLAGAGKIVLKGAGRDVTTLVCNTGLNGILEFDNIKGLVVEDLSFEVTGAVAFYTALKVDGTGAASSERVTVRNCRFTDTASPANDGSDRWGFLANRTRNLSVRDNIFEELQLETSHDCDRVEIADNISYSSFHLGICGVVNGDDSYLRYVNCHDNIVVSSGTYGISYSYDSSTLGAGTNIVEHISIHDNIVISPANGIAIYLDSGKQASLRGSRISDNIVFGGRIRVTCNASATAEDFEVVDNSIVLDATGTIGVQLGSTGSAYAGAVTRNGVANCSVRGNRIDGEGVASTTALYLTNAASIDISDNIINDAVTGLRWDTTHMTNRRVQGNTIAGATNAFGGLTWARSAGDRVANNVGFVTEASGTATVANGQTTIAVTHGLSETPALKDIMVTATNNLGSAAQFWTSSPTSSQFTINVDVDPGATTATFVWQAAVI